MVTIGEYSRRRRILRRVNPVCLVTEYGPRNWLQACRARVSVRRRQVPRSRMPCYIRLAPI